MPPFHRLNPAIRRNATPLNLASAKFSFSRQLFSSRYQTTGEDLKRKQFRIFGSRHRIINPFQMAFPFHSASRGSAPFFCRSGSCMAPAGMDFARAPCPWLSEPFPVTACDWTAWTRASAKRPAARGLAELESALCVSFQSAVTRLSGVLHRGKSRRDFEALRSFLYTQQVHAALGVGVRLSGDPAVVVDYDLFRRACVLLLGMARQDSRSRTVLKEESITRHPLTSSRHCQGDRQIFRSLSV